MSAFANTLTAASTTSNDLNSIPQYFDVVLGTAAITAISVNAKGIGTVLELDANGALQMGQLNQFYKNGQLIYRYYLADGEIPVEGGVCRITITLGAGTDGEGYSKSDQKGRNLIVTTTETVKAASRITFSKFTYLGLYNMIAADSLNYVLVNGHEETDVTLQEVQADALRRGSIGASTAQLQVLYNDMRTFKKVSFRPSTERVVYVQRFAPAKPLATADFE